MNYTRAEAELENWSLDPTQTNFHCLLYTLIAKADPVNRERLRKGFPIEVHVWEHWHHTGGQTPKHP